MKRWRYIVLLGLGIAGCAYVYLHRQELGLAGTHSFEVGSGANSELIANPSQPAHIIWQAVNRPKDGFKVEMPSDVKDIQIPSYNENGGTDQVNMIFSNPDADTTFSVAWADDPPVVRINGRSPDHVLDMARDDALARTQTSLVKETLSLPGGFPARDLVARNAEGGMMDFRLIFAGDRLYMLTAAFPSMSARREQDVARFFSSFKTSESPHIPESLPPADAPAQ